MKYVTDESFTRYHHQGLELLKSLVESSPVLRPGTMIYFGPVNSGGYSSQLRSDIWKDWMGTLQNEVFHGTCWKKPDCVNALGSQVNLIPSSDSLDSMVRAVPFFCYPLPSEIGEAPGELRFTYHRRIRETFTDTGMMELDRQGNMLLHVQIPGMEPCRYIGTKLLGPHVPGKEPIRWADDFFEWMQSTSHNVLVFGGQYKLYHGWMFVPEDHSRGILPASGKTGTRVPAAIKPPAKAASPDPARPKRSVPIPDLPAAIPDPPPMGQKADASTIYGPAHDLTLCPLPNESRVSFTLRIEEWIKGDTTSIWDKGYLRALQQLPGSAPAISPGDKLWTGISDEYLPNSKSEIWEIFGRTRADLHYRGKLRKAQARQPSTADTKQKAPMPSPNPQRQTSRLYLPQIPLTQKSSTR